MNKAPSSLETESKLGKLGRLSAWQWWVLICAPFVLLLSWHRLRTIGFKASVLSVQAKQLSGFTDSQQLQLAIDTAYALAVSIKFSPWNPTCLTRSLALAWFLGRKGLPFDVLIGIPLDREAPRHSTDPDFSTHAWVEQAGVVLNDKPDVRERHRVFGEMQDETAPASATDGEAS